MHWIREGADWVLKFNRRELGRVFPDDRYPNMWRSRRADGRLSDIANLSWAKNAVLIEVESDQAHTRAKLKKSPLKAGQYQGVMTP